jgi:hypothetical protein
VQSKIIKALHVLLLYFPNKKLIVMLQPKLLHWLKELNLIVRHLGTLLPEITAPFTRMCYENKSMICSLAKRLHGSEENWILQGGYLQNLGFLCLYQSAKQLPEQGGLQTIPEMIEE